MDVTELKLKDSNQQTVQPGKMLIGYMY